MARMINKIKNSQDGVAAIEFALILPVLLLIIFGIIEFGLLLFNKQVITNASREGARYGIVSQNPRVNDSEIATQVHSYCDEYLITFGAATDPGVSVSRTGSEFQDDLTVNVDYRYDFLFLPELPSVSLPGHITLSARTVMKYE